MKSCLFPPNLKKAGLKAFAKVLIFGELTKTEMKNVSVAVGTCKSDKMGEKKFIDGHKKLRPIKEGSKMVQMSSHNQNKLERTAVINRFSHCSVNFNPLN